MGDLIYSTEERNSDVQAWSEQEQQYEGDSTSSDYKSVMPAVGFLSTECNDVSGLKLIWGQWDRETQTLFREEFGDIAYLLDVSVDHALLQMLARFWNPSYSCFTFSDFDLTPTIEEYSDLINCQKIIDKRVYSKPSRPKSFREKMRSLSGMPQGWPEKQFLVFNEKTYLRVEGVMEIAAVVPVGSIQRKMFAFLIYGLVLFPKAKGLIDPALLDLFGRLESGVNPVPVILAETFRTLNFYREQGKGRFQACSHLLTVWFYSHIWTDVNFREPIYFSRFSPLQEFLLHKNWPIGRSQEIWWSVLTNFKEEELVWRAPWLKARCILYRCGEHPWVPLLGIWGHVAYAPLMVLRQYGSSQFVPATQGLRMFRKQYKGEVYRKDLTDAASAWNNARKVRIFEAPIMVTPGYKKWRLNRINDEVPTSELREEVSLRERLAMIPSEVEILKEQLEKERKKNEQLVESFNRVSFDKEMDKIEMEGVMKHLKKEKEKFEVQFQMERKENLRLQRLGKNKRVADRGLVEELEKRIQDEKNKVENYRNTSQELKNQNSLLLREMKEMQSRNASLREHIKNLETSTSRYKEAESEYRATQEESQYLKGQVDRLEDQVQQLKDQVERYRGTIQVRPTPTPEQLYQAAYTIWAQAQMIAEGRQFLQEIAQHVQLLAEDAVELHECIDERTEEGKKVVWILREIVDLGASLDSFV